MSEVDETAEAVERTVASSRVADLYRRGRHLFSTRTAEGFEAEDLADGSKLLLWLLRFPFAEGSDEVGRFIRRLGDVEAVHTPPPRMLKFGVDARGSAFAAMELLEGTSVFESEVEPAERVQLFQQVIEAVVPLHRAGICLGDICEDSFLLLPNGRVVLIGVVGAFETGARKTGSLPQADTLHYLAPEQRGSGNADFSSDVYALGVFGYRLCTGRYLQQEKFVREGVELVAGTAPAPSMIRPDLPPWLDDVLGSAVQPRTGRRYSDAGLLLQAVQSEGEINTVPNGRVYWSKRTVTVSAEQLATAKKPTARRERIPTAPVERRRPSGPPRMRPLPVWMLWTLAVLVGVAAAAAVFYSLMRPSTPDPVAPKTAVHLEYAPEELRVLIAEVNDPATSEDRRFSVLEEIADSANPIAHAVLISLTGDDTPAELQEHVQRLLIRRIREDRRYRSANVLERWFETALRSNPSSAAQAAYPLLLRASDKSRQLSSRQQALRDAANHAPVAALQLAAALALDGAADDFTPVVQQLAKQEGSVAGAEEMGLASLIFSHPSLGIFIDEELLRGISRFSDEDLYRAVEHLSKNQPAVAEEVLREALIRKRIPPYRAVFLEPLLEPKGETPSDLLKGSLIRASFGKTTEEDLFRFARWKDPSAERVLFAVVATSRDDAISLDAFDVLGGRSIRREPGRTLIAWMKRKVWNQRSRLMKAVAVLSLPEVGGEKEQELAFSTLTPFAKYGLFRAIVASDDPALIEKAVEQLSPVAKSEQLITLLGHQDKRVRIAAVRALKGRNDLAVLQSILQGYEKEENEEVRQVYRELHWVTRER